MICWKGTAEAARAVAAAMPFLTRAGHVILAGVEERDPSLAAGLTDLSLPLAWHGVSAVIEFLSGNSGSAGDMLLATARSHHADLLVRGGYGHSRMGETIFGGFTRSVLESADPAVFVMH